MMFDALGVIVAVYAVYCLLTGRVYARRGIGGESIFREASPVRFWTVVGIYFALAVALIAVF